MKNFWPPFWTKQKSDGDRGFLNCRVSGDGFRGMAIPKETARGSMLDFNLGCRGCDRWGSRGAGAFETPAARDSRMCTAGARAGARTWTASTQWDLGWHPRALVLLAGWPLQAAAGLTDAPDDRALSGEGRALQRAGWTPQARQTRVKTGVGRGEGAIIARIPRECASVGRMDDPPRSG